MRRIIVFVVNSLSEPKTDWDKTASAPGNIALLIKATGVPIDYFSYEEIELLRDIKARWQTMREIRDSGALAGNKYSRLEPLVNAPNTDLYLIDVSFKALADKAEVEYLNNLPTSFALPPEAIDRLRAAAGTIILSSPAFKQTLKDAGATLVAEPPTPAGARDK